MNNKKGSHDEEDIDDYLDADLKNVTELSFSSALIKTPKAEKRDCTDHDSVPTEFKNALASLSRSK